MQRRVRDGRPSGCKPLSLMSQAATWVVVRVVGKKAPANYLCRQPRGNHVGASVVRSIGRKGLCIGGWSRLP